MELRDAGRYGASTGAIFTIGSVGVALYGVAGLHRQTILVGVLFALVFGLLTLYMARRGLI